jgi:hypothetical protein
MREELPVDELDAMTVITMKTRGSKSLGEPTASNSTCTLGCVLIYMDFTHTQLMFIYYQMR